MRSELYILIPYAFAMRNIPQNNKIRLSVLNPGFFFFVSRSRLTFI